ncbi:unnamed protein product [Ixodes hexagonus]
MDSVKFSAKLETALKPTQATSVVTWLVLGTLSVGLFFSCVRLLAHWIRMYWILRHMRRPKRVCPGYWFMSELIVCRYWMDTHINVAARFFNFLKSSVETDGDADMVLYYHGPQPFVIALTPVALEGLVNSSNNVSKPFPYGFLKTLVGTGLIISGKKIWRPRRKTINPAFHARILDYYVPIMSRRLERFAKKLEAMNDSSLGYINIMTPVRSATFGVLMETVFGISDIEDEEFERSGHIKSLIDLCDGFISRILNVGYWSDLIFAFTSEGKKYGSAGQQIRDYSRKIIAARKEVLNDKATDKDSNRSFVDILLQMHMQDGTLTETDILDETVTILSAGFDTTASAAAFCLYLLGNHSDVQEKLHEELDRVFAHDVDRPVTLDDLRDLQYLDCVIKETLRLYPSVPIVARNIEEDMKIGNIILFFMFPGEQLIPRGTIVVALLYFIQRHPNFYEKPNSFLPERFQENNGRHPYAYAPFFGGPRNCIGK